MTEAWTTLKVLDWTTGRFERAEVPSARLDAQVLLAHVLQCQRVALYTSFDKPLDSEELGSYRELIQRRLNGEPVAYLTGKQEFWSLSFHVDSRVLIPRADTETLVQVALELGDSCQAPQSGLQVAEVATGSGAVAISLAHERKDWTLVATDLSPDAIGIARDNAERNGVTGRVDFKIGHLLEPLQGLRVGLLVANLPYISRKDMDSLPVDVRHEPRSALLGGDTGLELIRELVSGLGGILAEGGWTALEHGFDQAEDVRGIAASAGFSEIETRADLGGRARVTYFQKNKS